MPESGDRLTVVGDERVVLHAGRGERSDCLGLADEAARLWGAGDARWNFANRATGYASGSSKPAERNSASKTSTLFTRSEKP